MELELGFIGINPGPGFVRKSEHFILLTIVLVYAVVAIEKTFHR
jgi:hypothetical protein